MPPPRTISAIRDASKKLLGNSYRLEIVSAIARAGLEPVSAQELADSTGIRYPRVQQELKRLVEAGLLSEGAVTSQRTVEYKPVPSVYWRFCDELLSELAGDHPSDEQLR